VLKAGGLGGRPPAQALETIERNLRVMAKCIETFAENWRKLATTLRLDLQTVDLAAILRETGEAMGRVAEEKGVGLNVILPPSVPAITADPDRMAQVVTALLSNAMDRSPGGKVEMELSASPEEAIIVVRATGQAFPPGPLPRFSDLGFETQGEGRGAPGEAVIALAMARDLVELHGGKLDISRDEGTWRAVFTASLPLTRIVHEGNRELSGSSDQ
jgi:signal transduction histidine kinase